jgi:hypothetical protein
MVCNSEVHYINWTLAAEKGLSHKERDYSYPAYNEVAVSPCDLTEDSCDINCCSDQACYQKMNITNSTVTRMKYVPPMIHSKNVWIPWFFLSY